MSEHSAENDAVTSVEPGCTCGGMAACPQCQDRDAQTAAGGEAPMPDAEKDAGRIDALRIESDDGTLTFATRHDGQIEAQSDGLVVMDGATAIRLVEWLTDHAAGKGVGACGRTFQHDPHRYLDAQRGTRVRLCDGNARVLPPGR